MAILISLSLILVTTDEQIHKIVIKMQMIWAEKQPHMLLWLEVEQ